MKSSLVAPSRPRSPWQRLYGAGHAIRWRWYARRARQLPRPVVSVGNLHWGGSGKTPLVAAIASHLRDRGLFPAILSRGYRSSGHGVRVVSVGRGPLLGPLVAGDEPVLLAGDLPGVAVVVSPDRWQAGCHAMERLDPNPDVFVLDDGFSHLKLFRDLDLLAFPADDPYGAGRLFPGGRLREPLAAVARADAVILTGATGSAGSEFARTLRGLGFSGPGFTSALRTLEPRLETGELLAPGSRVLVVSAVARPERFVAAVRERHLEVAGVLAFADHHRYPERSLAKIESAWRRARADAVLTTAKDRVKLLGRLEMPLAELPVRNEPDPELWHWLDKQLAQQINTLTPRP